MRDHVRLVLGDEIHRVPDGPPDRTLLRYLRDDLGRCGTKEGCAEGDCGACTVVVGERRGEGVRYRAINACIAFLPALDGRQVLTVEDLADADGSLHPVQQALVDCHGSQCGFCTPGFVMSLFALYHSEQRPDAIAIDNALAGNLCRCTGYGPIVQAAATACRGEPDDRYRAHRDRTRVLLDELDDGASVALSHDGRRWFAPRTLDEAIALRTRHPQAWLLAGGTDVGLWVTKQQRRPDAIIWLGAIDALRRIEQRGGHLELGAGVTYADAQPALAPHFPQFAEMVRRIGATQVWNAGTLGGNIANGSPIGDTPPMLIAAGARLVLQGPEGEREIALEDYFIDYGRQDLRPGELVARIRLPLPAPEDRLVACKVSKRFDQDISGIFAAFALRLDDDRRVAHLRAAYGGMAATPKRALALEQALLGRPWDRDTVEAALPALDQDFTPIDDLRASAEYRRQVARNLVRRLWLETSRSGAQPTRLFGTGDYAHGSR